MSITANYTGAGTFTLTMDGQDAPLDDGSIISRTSGASGDVWYQQRQMTGSKSIGPSEDHGYSPSSWMFDVFTDDADAGSDFMVGFRMRHRFGGASAKGGREGLSGTIEMIAPTNSANANRNYVAVQGKAYSYHGDGGTDCVAGAKGAIFGGGFAAYNAAASDNMLDVAGVEINTFTAAGSSARFVRGVSIVLCNAAQGAEVDAFLSLSGMSAVGGYGPHAGSRAGILFTNKNGADPLATNATVIKADFGNMTKTVGTLIDFSQFSPSSGDIIVTPYTRLKTTGLVLGDDGMKALISVNGPSAAAHLQLEAKASGAVISNSIRNRINPAGYPVGTLWNNNGTVCIV